MSSSTAVTLPMSLPAAMQHLAGRADPLQWTGLRDRIDRDFADTDQLNLDRKQAILGAFFAIAELAR